MTQSAARVTLLAQGPVHHNLGAPGTTEPLTAAGILNGTIALAATPEKVVGAADTAKRARRVFIFNPHDTRYLAWTTQTKGTAAPVMSATSGGADTDGSPVPPLSQVEVIVPFNADLWLAASANGARYQVLLTENY